MKKIKKLIKDIFYFGNAISSLAYFRIFYGKLTPKILAKIEELKVIDPNWKKTLPKSLEEYLDLLIIIKKLGIKIK